MKIIILEEIRDLELDCLDVIVEFESGYTYAVVVTTPAYLADEMTQERQDINYQKAIKKIKEFKRVSPLLNNYQKLLTAEEKSAIDYFQGTGIYTKFQDPNTLPNIHDTRKTFLKKMENKKMREKFLEAYNRNILLV